MGNVIGKNVCKSEYVPVSTNSEESLSFDPSQSYAVAFCINRQTSPRFEHKQLSDTVVNDACAILFALQTSGAVSRENTKLFEAKPNPDLCKFAGMKKTYQEQAKMVGKGGIFFFHFSGHGIRVGDDQFGLAPVDFDYTLNTYITANVLGQWLREAKCEAKCAVFTIDCCYAGGLAEALTHDSNMLTPFPLYVMAACTANEKSFAIGTLKNTTYCYSLSHAIRTAEFSHGHFPIRHIHEKCEKLTTALSSLLLTYDEAHHLVSKTMSAHHSVSKTMHPKLTQSKYVALRGKGMIQADGGTKDITESQQYSYVFELYDSTMEAELHEECSNWLEGTYRDSNGALSQLQEEGVLGCEKRVMDTVLCCMLRSVASIQLECDSTTVASRSLYLTAYLQVVKAICSVCSGAKFDLGQCILGLAHYKHSLENCHQWKKIETQPLVQLMTEAKKLVNPCGGIRADSRVPVSQFSYITTI